MKRKTVCFNVIAIFLISVFILQSVSTAYCTQILSSYEQNNNHLEGLDGLWNNATNDNGIAQTFVASASSNNTLMYASFYMLKSGSPTGNGHAGLWNVSSNLPQTQLALSDDFDISTLTTSAQWINFTFSGSNKYNMTVGTTYAITFQNPTSGTVGGGNYPNVYYNSTGTTGHMAKHQAGWSSQTGTYEYKVSGCLAGAAATFSNVSASYPAYGYPVEFQAYIMSGANPLSKYIFSQNDTGNWVNTTAVSITGTDSYGNYWASVTMVLNGSSKDGYQFFANDTTNAWSGSGIYTVDCSAKLTEGTVGNTTTEIGIRWQEKWTYANWRYWVFYMNKSGTSGYGYYASSADLLSWTTPVQFTSQGIEYEGENLQAIFDSSGNFEIFYRNTTSILYAVMHPDVDGSLTVITDWTAVWTPASIHSYYITTCDFYAAIDSYGYPWISWEYGTSVANCTVFVTKSDLNNGTWHTASGWPQQVANLTESTEYYTNSFMMTLQSGKMYVSYFRATSGQKLYGKIWSGSSWSTDETISSSSIIQQYGSGQESWSRSSTVDTTGNIYVLFLASGATPTTPGNLVCVVRNSTTSTWSSETVVYSTMYAFASPALALDQTGELLWAFWINDQHHIFAEKLDLITSTWDSTPITIVYDADDITIMTDSVGNDGRLNSFPQVLGASIGLLWVENTTTAGVYNVKLAVFIPPGRPYVVESLNITDMDAGNWLFANSKSYHVEASFTYYYNYSSTYTIIDTVMLYFTDGLHNITIAYRQGTNTMSVVSGSDDVNVQNYGVIAAGLQLNVTFGVHLTQSIVDASNVDVSLWLNDTLGTVMDWSVVATNYFNIYNLGGLTTLQTSGSAGHYTGGDAFQIYAYNNAYARANITFTDVRHMKLMLTLKHNMGTVGVNGYVRFSFGADFWYNYTWHSIYVNITSTINLADIGNNPWEVLNATMYYDGTGVATQSFYTFWNNDTHSEWLYVDMWYNAMNASSTFGIRLGARYYAMTDSSNAWFRWLTGSNWGALQNASADALMFTPLTDASANQIGAAQIPLTTWWAQVQRFNVTASDEYGIVECPTFDLTHVASSAGIQTPIFDAPVQPNMPQGGLFGALFSALAGMGTVIYGVLASFFSGAGTYLGIVFSIVVGWLDTVAAWAGFPNLFSNFATWLGSMWSAVTSGFTWLAAILVQGLTFLSSIMTSFLGLLTNAVNVGVSFVTGITNLLTGTGGWVTNIWVDYQLSTWITVFFILYPIYLVFLWDEYGLDAVISQLSFIMGVLSFIITGIIRVVNLFVTVVSALIESIPVVE